ncbi:MAG: hypothetical protein WCL50_01170 [Spirochaetota bacterium]
MTEVFGSYFQEEVIVLKSVLDSAGLQSEILAGSMTDLAPFFSVDTGGFRLIVADDDAEDARALVAEHRATRLQNALDAEGAKDPGKLG